MKKIYTLLLVALGAVLLATYGVNQAHAITDDTASSAVQRVVKDDYYTNNANSTNSTATKSVLTDANGHTARVAELFIGNGNADVTNDVHYTVDGQRLTVTNKPAGVSAYYVELSDNGATVKVVETKNGVTRTRVGHANTQVQAQVAQKTND